MKPCTRRGPKIGKKNTIELWCTNFWQSSECSCGCTYEVYTETNGKQQLDNPNYRIGSMVTHFQLPPNEFHWATRQVRDIAVCRLSRRLIFLWGAVVRQYATSLINYPVQNRVGGSWVSWLYLWLWQYWDFRIAGILRGEQEEWRDAGGLQKNSRQIEKVSLQYFSFGLFNQIYGMSVGRPCVTVTVTQLSIESPYT